MKGGVNGKKCELCDQGKRKAPKPSTKVITIMEKAMRFECAGRSLIACSSGTLRDPGEVVRGCVRSWNPHHGYNIGTSKVKGKG